VAGDFEVQPGELSQAAAGLQGLLNQVSEAGSQVSAGGAGAAGDARLEAALSQFLSHWSQGLQQVHGSLSDLAVRIEEAAVAYETADAEVGAAFIQ
jgi:hypothetical protein